MYATQQENHPACLVHGPLSGTWMMELLRKQTADFITDFEYKCLMPLYVNQPLTVAGRPTANDPQRYELWITNHQGYLAVKGSATTVKCQ
jgi:3-methylfumaryl-CoA hydratase